MNALTNISRHPFEMRRRKTIIQADAVRNAARRKIDPRTAKHRTIKGISLAKRDRVATVVLQLSPVIALAGYLIYKFVI